MAYVLLDIIKKLFRKKNTVKIDDTIIYYVVHNKKIN